MPLNDSAAKIATDPLLSAIPHIDQLFGAWAIYEPAMEALRAQIELLDLANHLNSPMAIAARDRASQPVQLEMTNDGIAIIRIVGSMQKQESSFGGASTVTARKKLRAARSDDVRGVMMWFETPGGTVAGTAELGDEIASLSALKPVHAFGEDLVASAGYWGISQTQRISVNRMAQVGSIGTFSVVYDYSRHADQQGVKVHVVRAGQFKGVGTPGTEVTAEQLAMLQEHIKNVNEHFLQAVATGRQMSIENVRTLADGRVYLGEEAKRLGLVDAVSTFDEALAALVKTLPNRSKKAMTTENNNPPARVAATVNEIKAGCPGATSDFMVEQLGKSATLAEAQSAWMQEQAKATQKLQDDLKAEQAKTAAAEEKAKAAEAKGTSKKGKGVDPIRATSGGDEERDGDPVAEFNAQVASMCGKNPTFEKRQRAIRTVANRDPELYQDYLLATNSGKKAQRLILEKLEDAS